MVSDVEHVFFRHLKFFPEKALFGLFASFFIESFILW
jgi:hypothetical protein